MSKTIITKDMNIKEVLRDYPQLLEVFLDHEIGCATCPHAQAETIETGIAKHGINVDRFVQLLNDHLEFVKKEK